MKDESIRISNTIHRHVRNDINDTVVTSTNGTVELTIGRGVFTALYVFKELIDKERSDLFLHNRNGVDLK